MARRGFFAHVDPDGRDPTDRAAAAGFACRQRDGPGRERTGVAENLALYGLYRSTTETRRGTRVSRTTDRYTPDGLAEAVVAGWLASPGHRRNLLDARHATAALGVHVRGGDVFVMQSFY